VRRRLRERAVIEATHAYPQGPISPDVGRS
jgi:hypothetical protein